MRRTADSWAWPYGKATLAVVLATIIRQLLDPWLGQAQIFSWYYMAVAVGAWCGGWRCCLAASILGYAAADWFFIEPRHSFIALFSETRDWLAFASYLVVCTAIAVSTEAIRRQAPALVCRLDIDDGLELLDVAAAVRIHGIRPDELPEYLEGLNVSHSVHRLALHLSRHDMTSRELATRFESFVKGSGPVTARSWVQI